jgi:cytochrome b6-f complex iron-sulfur subunit
MSKINRRDFLKITATGFLATSGLLGLGGLLRFMAHPTQQAAVTKFDLGPASNYPIGSRTLLPHIPALLIHTESGFSALSLVCTHLGCTVEAKEDGFVCPCHGSSYANDGSLLTGPAVKGLPKLRIERTTGEKLILHTK